jgi:hypothetical protein
MALSHFVIFFLVVVMFSDVSNITSLLLYKFETVKDVKWHFVDTATLFISMNTFTHRDFVFFNGYVAHWWAGSPLIFMTTTTKFLCSCEPVSFRNIWCGDVLYQMFPTLMCEWMSLVQRRWASLTSAWLPPAGNYLMAAEVMTVVGLSGRGQRNLCMGK